MRSCGGGGGPHDGSSALISGGIRELAPSPSSFLLAWVHADIHTHAHAHTHVTWAQWEGCLLWNRKRTFTRGQPLWHPDPRCPASRTLRIHVCGLCPQSLACCEGSQSWQTVVLKTVQSCPAQKQSHPLSFSRNTCCSLSLVFQMPFLSSPSAKLLIRDVDFIHFCGKRNEWNTFLFYRRKSRWPIGCVTSVCILTPGSQGMSEVKQPLSVPEPCLL